MAKRFQVSERALERLQWVENDAALRDELSDLSTEEETLSFLCDGYLTTEDVCSVLKCSHRTIGKLGVPAIRIGNTVRYSADMVRQWVHRALREQADAMLASTAGRVNRVEK